MDNESQVIHHQMEETRSSLQDKLETLEQQVKNTVQGATEAISETVETVKDTVQETVATVKGTVEETVETVKTTFDLAYQVDRHPWPMFLGATAVGFVATRWLIRDSAPTLTPAAPSTYGRGPAAYSYTPAPTPPPQPPAQPPQRSGLWNWVAEHYSEELAKVKGLAIGALGGVVRDMLTESAPPTMAEQIKEVVDGMTAKLGGRVFEGPVLKQNN